MLISRKTLYLSAITAALIALAGCNRRTTNNTNDPAPSPTSSPTTTTSQQPNPTPNNSPEKAPQDWTYVYDGALEVSLAYPNSWSLSPATGAQGELAVTSFDPSETPNTGPVPADEIKVAIIHNSATSSRDISFNEDEIISEEEVTIDGFTATRREINGNLGTSISTQITFSDGQSYLISAYPADSQMIQTYDELLSYIDLDASAPVMVGSPNLGASIDSPVSITGSATGTWMFEGVLPITLRTLQNESLGSALAQTSGDWMTQDQVDFTAELSFSNASANLAVIYFEKNNPSGLPHNGGVFTWPVTF